MYSYLSETNVKTIKKKLMKGMSLTELAEYYETSVSNIGHIVSGKTWSDLTVDGFAEWQSNRSSRKQERKEAKLKVKKAPRAFLEAPKRKSKMISRKVREVEVSQPIRKTYQARQPTGGLPGTTVVVISEAAIMDAIRKVLPDYLKAVENPIENLVTRIRKTKKAKAAPKIEAVEPKADVK